MSTDHELLARHRAGSADAFAELAARHVDWVYAAARRRVGDDHLAEDVTQRVLAALAADGRAGGQAGVANWLFGVLRHMAARAVRDRARRRRYETAAAAAMSPAREDADAWRGLAPLLENAVAQLRPRDRQAVLLRFYQRQTFAEVGAAIGVSEDGARKRVGRAVGQLRRYFSARGVTTAEAALPTLLLGRCAEPAPAAARAVVPRPWVRPPPWLGPRWPAAACGVVAVAVAAAVPWWLAAPAAERPAAVDARPADPPPPVVSRASPTVEVEPPTRPTAVTFDQISAAVGRAESQFTNVHVRDFDATVADGPTPTGPWTTVPRSSAGSAWYGADPAGPQRVYFSRYVAPWRGGPAPSVEQVLDLSGDGTTGLTLELATHAPGRWMRRRSAWVSTGWPARLDPASRYRTGVGYTLQYTPIPFGDLFPAESRVQLSDVLRWSRTEHRLAVGIVAQPVNGFDAVRLQVSRGPASLTCWLDPAHGYAVVRMRALLIGRSPTTYEGFDVFDLQPAGPGLWFPMRATAVVASGVGTCQRFDYRAAAATVNDPAFDPAVLRPPIPVGWDVTDERPRPPLSYVTRPDGTRRAVPNGAAMPDVSPGEDARPDEPGPAITRDPRAMW